MLYRVRNPRIDAVGAVGIDPMNEQTALPQPPETVTGDRKPSTICCWFFALVYVVEGLGQIGGLISQPLNYYLKAGRKAGRRCRSPRFITLFNLPWMIKPLYGLISDFVPLFGYRRKSYLLIVNVAAIAGFFWVTQLTAPERALHRADDYRLRHGDFEHAVRRRAGGERPAASRERHLRQSAMAVVQHRRHGGRDHRRPAGPASAAGRRAAQRRRDHCRVAPFAVIVGALVSGPRAKSLDQSAGHEKHARRPHGVIPSARAVARRRVHVSLLFQPRLEHAALLSP